MAGTTTTRRRQKPAEAAPIERVADPAADQPAPTSLTAGQVAMLEAPLDQRRVQKREGSGRQSLSYLMTHDVKRTANRVFGFDGWSAKPTEIVCLGEEHVKRNGREGFRVAYRATVEVTIGQTVRGDTGYGDAVEYTGSRLTPHELASKEAVSDAIKRCLSSWGDQFGLCLYGADPAPPVEEDGAAREAAKHPEQRRHELRRRQEEMVTDKEEVTRLAALARTAGYTQDQVIAICKEECERHGGYRRSWLTEQLQSLNKQIQANAEKAGAAA